MLSSLSFPGTAKANFCRKVFGKLTLNIRGAHPFDQEIDQQYRQVIHKWGKHLTLDKSGNNYSSLKRNSKISLSTQGLQIHIPLPLSSALTPKVLGVVLKTMSSHKRHLKFPHPRRLLAMYYSLEGQATLQSKQYLKLATLYPRGLKDALKILELLKKRLNPLIYDESIEFFSLPQDYKVNDWFFLRYGGIHTPPHWPLRPNEILRLDSEGYILGQNQQRVSFSLRSNLHGQVSLRLVDFQEKLKRGALLPSHEIRHHLLEHQCIEREDRTHPFPQWYETSILSDSLNGDHRLIFQK